MKKLLVALAVIGTALMFGLAVLPGGASADPSGKVFVCKYVTTPGGGEVLQSGNNPISTSVSSIPTYDANDPAKDEASELVGDEFSDGQGRSLVLVEDTGQVPEPDVNDCPPPVGPCPSGTMTTTITETVTVTVTAAAALQVEDPCNVTVTQTVTQTITESPPPPREVITGSLSTPVCTNQNIVATGDNPTDDPITFDVFVNAVLVDSFIVAAHTSGTSASIPVVDGDIVTLRVQGGEAQLLDVETVDLECATTTVTTPPPPPPPHVTTTTTTTTTAPPPTTTQPPPPPGGGNEGPPENQPPPENLNPPDKLAFTGPEDIVPIGLVALALLLFGSALLWMGRKPEYPTPPRPDLDLD